MQTTAGEIPLAVAMYRYFVQIESNQIPLKAQHLCGFLQLLSYYNTFLNTAYNSCGFHIYLSPFFTNYDAIICKMEKIILTESSFSNSEKSNKLGFIVLLDGAYKGPL